MTLAGTQSSAKLSSAAGHAFIHPTTYSSPIYSGRLWLEAGVTEAAHSCPCPPEPTVSWQRQTEQLVVQCGHGDEHIMIPARWDIMLVRDKFHVPKAELGEVLLLVRKKPLLGGGPLQVCKKYKEACKASPCPSL